MEVGHRLLDAIAVLLVAAPLVNLYFLRLSVIRYRRDTKRSPLLLSLLVILSVIWIIGAIVAMLSVAYLLRPEVDPTSPIGLFFGAGLLLIQALPHYIELQIRRIERDASSDP